MSDIAPNAYEAGFAEFDRTDDLRSAFDAFLAAAHPVPEDARAILVELVRLKDLKQVDPAAYEAERAAKEDAWARARAVLGRELP